MDFNDKNVLENLNNIIKIKRLNRKQIIQMVQLLPISNDFEELNENFEWENSEISIKY